MSTSQSPIRILDAHVPLEQPAEAQGPEGDVPDAVVDRLEADVLADADRGDVDPAVIPRSSSTAVPASVVSPMSPDRTPLVHG
jgi:hypothetical protein